MNAEEIYRKLGVPAAVNAVGTGTLVGGSGPPDFVREAMEAASGRFVRMNDLLRACGDAIAAQVGTEAAYISCGGAAGVTLSAAACIAGSDPEAIRRLPDAEGLRHDIVVQKRHSDSYDRCLRAAGARLVEVGREDGCDAGELEAGITADTVAIWYPWPPLGDQTGLYPEMPGPDEIVPLEEAHAIGRRHGVPVIADAASDIYPLDLMRRIAAAGDLVIFGGKYFGGPNASGFVCGDRGLIEAVAAQGFTMPAGAMGIGRSMKLDRQQVIALTVAVERWFATDHAARFAAIDRKLAVVEQALSGLPHVQLELHMVCPMEDVVHRGVPPVSPHIQLVSTMVSHGFYGSFLVVELDTAALGRTAPQIAEELYVGKPSVLVQSPTESALWVFFYTVEDGEERIIADRMRAVLRR